MTCWVKVVRWGLPPHSSFLPFRTHHTCYVLHYFKLPPLQLTYFWTWFWQPYPNILFELLSDIAISFDIPDIFLAILSDTFFQTFLQTNLLTFYLTYLVTSCNYFFDTLFLQLLPILAITVEVRHATLNSHDRGWGPVCPTELAWSQLGSGTPHWTRIIAVEVRYAPLNSQDRGWGPVCPTELAGSRLRSGTPHWTRRIAVAVRYATLHSQDRGWSPARHTELTGSQLRSDMPHWTHRIATGQGDGRRGGGEGEGEREGEGGGGGEETDIKSNNPHLTGGEKGGVSVSFRVSTYHSGVSFRCSSPRHSAIAYQCSYLLSSCFTLLLSKCCKLNLVIRNILLRSTSPERGSCPTFTPPKKKKPPKQF